MRDREHTRGLRSPQSGSRTGSSTPFALGCLQRCKDTSSERNEVGLSPLRYVRIAQPDPRPLGVIDAPSSTMTSCADAPVIRSHNLPSAIVSRAPSLFLASSRGRCVVCAPETARFEAEIPLTGAPSEGCALGGAASHGGGRREEGVRNSGPTSRPRSRPRARGRGADRRRAAAGARPSPAACPLPPARSGCRDRCSHASSPSCARSPR